MTHFEISESSSFSNLLTLIGEFEKLQCLKWYCFKSSLNRLHLVPLCLRDHGPESIVVNAKKIHARMPFYG